MKTIGELYKEVVANEELKKEFLSLKPDGIEGFAKANGCDATLAEIKDFFENKNKSGELSDLELDQVAGGKSASGEEVAWSICTLGLGCVTNVCTSLMDGNVGTAIEGEGMLCDKYFENNKD